MPIAQGRHRLNLSEVRDTIRRIIGEETAAQSQITNANLYIVVNRYAQRIPSRMTTVVRQSGIDLPYGTLRPSMWKTQNGTATGSGVTTASLYLLPNDYDHYIAFYDTTAGYQNRVVPVLKDVNKNYPELVNRPYGEPVEAVEILDFQSVSSVWRRVARRWPGLPTGGVVTDLNLLYYRLPAAMAGTDPDNEYPDTDLKFQDLWVFGPVLELLRKDDPSYERYVALEQELLLDLAYTSKAV